jgi:hypothetical protein
VDNPASTFLFHRPEFIFRHSETEIITFEESGSKIYFSRLGNSLISLDKSPFGSFVLTSRNTKSDLYSLLEKVVAWSTANGIASLIVRSFPDVYQPVHSTLIKNALSESGFSVKCEDITQVIHVSETSPINLNIHKKRRLRQAESKAFVFRQIRMDCLDEAYARIVESRESKGYPVTMTLKDLKAMFNVFPDDYLLFGVFDQNILIATAVCIKINNEIMYCFYLGDALAYRRDSPITLLINGVFEYCKRHLFKILDLGLSTDKGILNTGLYEFKKSFGSVDSQKLTFLKLL